MIQFTPLALLVSQPSIGSRLMTGLFDDTFSGIYRLSPFDWALLVPYFGILIILSIYGIHRYETILRYRKYRKNLLTAPAHPFRKTAPRDHPASALQRTIRGGAPDRRESARWTTRANCSKFRCSTTPPTKRIPSPSGSATSTTRTGYPIEYRHRTNRHGYKAGALQEGMETATGEFIAIFDADFVPPRRFPHSAPSITSPTPEVGMVQTRWSYLNREYNILTEVEAMLLDGHFVLEHGARCGAGLFFNFNGTAGILRREMIDDAGGWQHDTLTEDSDLSYRAQLEGLAIRLCARHRVPVRTAGRDLRLPGAAVALGQRA